MAELKEEEQVIAEIESCDQEYLNELKTSLAEQRYEPVTFRAYMAPDFPFRPVLSWMCIELMSPKLWPNSRG